MQKDTPAILVIVGITGDLAKRKLLPAIAALAARKELPEQFRVLGITRQANVGTESLFEQIEDKTFLKNNVTLLQMDLTAAEEYKKLQTKLEEIEKGFGTPAQKLFYLSVPPEVAKPIVGFLGDAGLAHGESKLLLEKPSGTDAASAKDLIAHTEKHFTESQIYRIDHYLAKAMVQNISVFRKHAPLFEAVWNQKYIERIEIIASEKIGIEGRVAFYEQTGALRDLIQSHLLQVAALTLMEVDGEEGVAARRLATLKKLSALPASALRGQYAGYKEEVKNPNSTTETFAAVTLESKDPRWAGVPIVLATGKNLYKKATEMRLYFKGNSKFVIELQLEAGAQVKEGYERVFFDAMHGMHDVFVSSEEVLECWRIADPIQAAWKNSAESIPAYKKGSSLSSVLKKPPQLFDFKLKVFLVGSAVFITLMLVAFALVWRS